MMLALKQQGLDLLSSSEDVRLAGRFRGILCTPCAFRVPFVQARIQKKNPDGIAVRINHLACSATVRIAKQTD